MDLPSVTTANEAALAFALIGLALTVWALRALSARRRDRAWGSLVAVDAGRGVTLRSGRYRLVGRPDELRRRPDGRLVPVEIKSRTTPPRGPAPSHVVQVRAYCLLVEESTGRAPPYGILRYSDQEFRVGWDAEARRELLAVWEELERPYDGHATPSPGRCAHCPWVDVCDARAV